MGLFVISDIVLMALLLRVPFRIIATPLLAILLIAQIVAYFSNRLILDKNRVTLKVGILRERITEMPFDKINSVAVKRSIIGRIMDFGNIVIYTGNDVSGIALRSIDKPNEVKKQLRS